MTDWAWWVLVAILLAVIEMLSLNLVFIMLAVGAAAGAVTAAIGAPVVVEVIIAGVVAVLMLFVVRPVALRHLRIPVHGATNAAALVGRPATVLERVDSFDGRVKIGGEVWSARAEPDSVLEPGASVTVVRIDGATALVAPAAPAAAAAADPLET